MGHDGLKSSPTILCVDDDPQVLHALGRVLRADGWRILTATNGAAALAILEREHVHVLLCDEAMPAMRGVELLRRAKELSPTTARVLLTAHCGMPTVVLPAVNEGEVFRLLAKPWNDDELRAAVAAALGAPPDEWLRARAQAQTRLRGGGGRSQQAARTAPPDQTASPPETPQPED